MSKTYNHWTDQVSDRLDRDFDESAQTMRFRADPDEWEEDTAEYDFVPLFV